MIAYKDLKQGKKHSWCLDIGASNHMGGGNKDLFVKLDEKVCGNITFGDSSKKNLRGKGKIWIQLKDESHQFISNVYYAPDMKCNILIMGQLLKKCNVFITQGCNLVLKDDVGRLIAKVPMAKNRLFLLPIQIDMVTCLTSYYKDSSWLWHLRLGHLNYGELKMVASKSTVKGLPLIKQPNHLCE